MKRREKPGQGDPMAEKNRCEDEVRALRGKVAVLERSVKDFKRKSRFFELLIRSLPGVFYLTDQSLRFQNWNKNLEKMTRYSPEELKERTIYDVFSGKGLERIRQAVETAFSEGEAFQEAELVAKDGTTIPHFFTGVSARIEETSYLLGMGTDLSARKRAEDALRESEEFYRMLAERMTIGVMLFQDFRIVFANDAFSSMFGFENPDQLPGEDVMGLVTEEFKEGLRDMVSAFEKGAIQGAVLSGPLDDEGGTGDLDRRESDPHPAEGPADRLHDRARRHRGEAARNVDAGRGGASPAGEHHLTFFHQGSLPARKTHREEPCHAGGV